MSDLATIACVQMDGRFVVRVTGEIDISNAQDLAATIESSVPNSAPVLVVDLTDTRYLDSSGVALLLRLSERLKARRQELRLLVPRSAPVRAVLELTGLGKVMALDAE